MLWLVIVIFAYFLFAIVAVGDRYLLIGAPNPKIYSFYVGILGGLSLVLIPFVGFFIPAPFEIVFALFAGVIFLFAIFSAFEGLEKFEASRIIPAIGGLVPIFTYIFVYAFSGGKETLGIKGIIALILLLIGSVLITYNPKKKFLSESLKISAITAVFFSLMFVLSKYVYLMLPFWTGFIWMRIGLFLSALCFLFFKDIRRELFSKKKSFNRKTGTIFVLNQAVGASATILQNWAIALAPLAFLSIINALQGVQYLFLFVLTLILFKSLKEDISKRTIIQKVFAIIVIILGLVIITI